MFETAEAHPIPVVRGSALGLDLATGVPLATPLSPPLGAGRPLRVVPDDDAPPRDAPRAGLRFPGAAEFRFWDHRIGYRLIGPVDPSVLEILLLGQVLSYWLELRGIVVLHASAVVIDGAAVAFLASNRGGKTSLAASFLEAGYPLLSDDILPIELELGTPCARSAYPQMRMWPGEATRFVGTASGLPRVHPELEKRRISVGSGGFGRFDGRPRPLSRIYLPQRTDLGPSSTRVRPAPPAEAVIELVRHSFVADLIADHHDLVSQRIETLGRLAATVPVRRLEYPSGYDRLNAVREAILADLGAG